MNAPRNKWTFGGLLVLVALAAAAMRLPHLNCRPMHADEAVQAARFRDLWLRGDWRYDPHEYHGPTLNYLTLPLAAAWGAHRFDETTPAMYRTLPVLFSLGLVLLVGLLADAWGKPAALCAAVLAAFSPAMVFYSRYYIHETLFVFFTFGAWAFGWRAYRSGSLAWYLACGACLGMMQATKETSVIVFAAMGGATLSCGLWGWASPDAACRGNGTIRGRYLALAGLTALVVAASWLSSFGRNPRGPLDGLLAYLPWLGRAVGRSPHLHPWYYYLKILTFSRAADGRWWSEGLILGLAAIGGLVVLGPRAPIAATGIGRPLARWVALCTLLLTAAYAAIPYKTPWCLLGFLHGMVLLAGVGAVAVVRLLPSTPLKTLATLALAAATGHLAWQAYRASYVLPADPKNPYAYVQSTADIERLAKDAATISAAAPQTYDVAVAVVWEDNYYWPLPWYLRRFRHVGYWSELHADPNVPLIIASPRHDAALTRELDATHLMTGYYAVRPNVLAQLWVRMDLWEAHLRRQGRL